MATASDWVVPGSVIGDSISANCRNQSFVKQSEPMCYVAEGNAVALKNEGCGVVRLLKAEEIGAVA